MRTLAITVAISKRVGKLPGNPRVTFIGCGSTFFLEALCLSLIISTLADKNNSRKQTDSSESAQHYGGAAGREASLPADIC